MTNKESKVNRLALTKQTDLTKLPLSPNTFPQDGLWL